MHKQQKEPRKSRAPIHIVVLLALSAMIAAPSATAHSSEAHGELTIHDEVDGEDTRDLSCEFWVKGYGMSADNGTVSIAHRLSTSDAHTHVLAEWQGTPDGEGTFSFVAGPMTIHESGEFDLLRANIAEEPPAEHSTGGYHINYTACPDGPDEDPPAETEDPPVETSECPPVELDGFARSDGSIALNASGLHATDFEGELALMRSDGGEFEQVASLEVGSQFYSDTDTEVGTTYTYKLVLDGETCAMVEVTAIPVFPTLLAGGAAIGVSILGYAAMRRRR